MIVCVLAFLALQFFNHCIFIISTQEQPENPPEGEVASWLNILFIIIYL